MRLRFIVWWASFAAAVAACGPSAPPASAEGVSAGQAATASALERLFRAPQADPRWFAPSFLAQDPLERVQDLLDVVRLTVGDFQGVRGTGQDYVVRFSSGEKSVRAKLDEEGRFVVLLIGPG
jgi:hypothetical protein